MRNYFVYCLSKSKEAPLAFLTAGPKPLPSGPRNMWCTAPMLHAAGRNIYERGNDDFVALTPREADKAGLTSKLVDAFEFVPVRLSVASQPASDAQGTKTPPPIMSVRWDNPPTATYLFRSHERRYERIMACCLKNLLAELGRWTIARDAVNGLEPTLSDYFVGSRRPKGRQGPDISAT